ncbi:hypothetical protein GGI07_001489 [Coemansia sp. Benny D115]|nr:hypothetical protein GGI07_001489 [Coemansia sp. Benny D115]
MVSCSGNSTKQMAALKPLMSSSGLNESLRGMNQQPVLSAEERVQRKMEEREQAAVRFEQHQELMSQAVDDLAQLMSGGGTNQ